MCCGLEIVISPKFDFDSRSAANCHKMAFVSKVRLAAGGLSSIQKSLFSSSSIQMSKVIEEVVVIGGGLMGAGIAQVRSYRPV